jgi:SH3-like domain-containing protein
MKNFMPAFRLHANAVACATALCILPAFAQAPAAPPATVAAPAAQFVAIGDKPAVAYDSPSLKGNRIFIFSRFHPLEVLVRLGGWTKVRDADGGIGWVENSALGARRFAMVQVPVAQIRLSVADGAALVFEAQRGVVLEATGPATDGWLPVTHRDGQSGFGRATQVWGN